MASPSRDLPPARWIDTDAGLAEVLPRLREAQRLALDTEADSYFVYRVKVCLVQVSTRESDFLIDPLAECDLAPLGELLADPAVEKVLHGGSNDVALLRHHYGFELENLFDTMLAAQVLGLRRPGLASLLEEHFGVVQPKSFQTSDWRRRPLTPGQLRYATLDTHYLLPLRDLLREQLVAKGRWEEAQEEFDRLRFSSHTERTFDPDGYLRVRGARDLDGLGLRVLAEAFGTRDKIASSRNRAPHRILSDRALIEVARRRPRSAKAFDALESVASWQRERYGQQFLQAVGRAVAQGPLRPPGSRSRGRSEFHPPMTAAEKRLFERLRSWRRSRAGKRDVEESRVVTTGALRAVARERPRTLEQLAAVDGISPFRVKEYGEEILRVVRETIGSGSTSP